jgi:hypothetical protein
MNKLKEQERYFTEAKTSIIYGLLNSAAKQSMAIISPYRASVEDESGNLILLTEEDYQRRLAELKDIVKNKYGLSYIQFKSIWVENGVDAAEYSLLIGPIDYKTAFDLAQKYNQTSFIFKDEDGKLYEVYSTTSKNEFYRDHKIGDVIRIFKNSGQYLDINTAIAIFDRKNRPFSLAELKEVREIHEPRPSYFQTEVREVRIL